MGQIRVCIFKISSILYQTIFLATGTPDEKLEVGDLSGNLKGTMYYYLETYVGNFDEEEDVAQKQLLIIDTGSTITALPCEGY